MKIIAENPAEEALLWRIKALSDELVNQDNRSTNMPVWTILDNNKAGKHTGVVERLDNLAGFGLRMVKNNFRYTFSELDTMGIDLDTLEVAGNIHEDPELLEEK